jgi:GTP pyrophosphokinase
VLNKLREAFPAVFSDSAAPAPALKPWSGYGKPSHGIRVKGVENVVVNLSRCCNPVPGDEVVGYVTRGRGISVHRQDCLNILHHHDLELERIIEVAWDDESEATYQVHIEAVALPRQGLAVEIMSTIADTKTIINAVHSRANRNNLSTVDLKIEIKSMEHLSYVMDKIRRVKDVLEVKRVTPH